MQKVDLIAAKHRTGFEVASQAKRLSCPGCGASDQAIHDRVRRSWRHLDFFQFEAWLHAPVPRVGCTACGKTTQVPVGIGEINLQRGQDYVSVVHDLVAKRLLFATPGRDHTTVQRFAADLEAHGGKRTAIADVCMDMSAAFAKGVTESLPNAQISYDRYHVVALANQAMDEVRSAGWGTESRLVREALGDLDARERRSVLWAMRRNPSRWSATQTNAMHWLQRANLKSARAWRLKMGLREVFARARSHNNAATAPAPISDAGSGGPGAAGWPRSSHVITHNLS